MIHQWEVTQEREKKKKIKHISCMRSLFDPTWLNNRNLDVNNSDHLIERERDEKNEEKYHLVDLNIQYELLILLIYLFIN